MEAIDVNMTAIVPWIATSLPAWEIVVRLTASVFCGLLIGLDREWKHKPAGIRTHMLVCLAATTFTILAMELYVVTERGDGTSSADPVRIIEAVTAGVAFLGAGSIIRSGADVQGMTTGASIWLAGAIGVACGAGYYVLAVINVALALIILTVLGYIAYRLQKAAARSEGNGTPG